VSVRKDIETASDAEWAIASQRAEVMDRLLSQSNAASVGEAARELFDRAEQRHPTLYDRSGFN